MIMTRERIKPAEILRGLFLHYSADEQLGLAPHVPLDKRFFFLTNQGKIAFEQIVITEKLENSKILLPAFIPDDFVGIFKKYNITPAFIDVDPETYHLNLNAINEEHLDGARALVLLHTFGLPANGEEYRAYCEKHELILIEDCARALGASIAGKLVGSFGHYALFSLPKCTPVRQGGIGLSEKEFKPNLEKSEIGIFGLMNVLTLIKFPLLSFLEAPAYRLFADTSVYPREVGIHKLLTGRELESLCRFILKSFLPKYGKILKQKRIIATRIRDGLEPVGFKFQKDNGGHIFTSLSAEPPPDCDSEELRSFLINNGVKVSHMWRGALGISELSQHLWGTNPEKTAVAFHLSKRLIQFPISRFQTTRQSNKIIELCKTYVSKL
jgi:dTDP-4-amino-4,6-dideoxygalactose transaminase